MTNLKGESVKGRLALVLPSRHAVDCWIGVVKEADRLVVKLAGRLSAAQVPELLTACADDEGALELDLSDLVSADAPGIEAVQLLRGKGARLVGVPGYIRLKLEQFKSEGAISPLMASRSRHVVSRDRVLPDRNGEPLFLQTSGPLRHQQRTHAWRRETNCSAMSFPSRIAREQG